MIQSGAEFERETLRLMHVGPPGLRFRLIGEEAPPAREAVVAGLMAVGDLVVMYGAPGCGKSALAAALAVSIANGSDFMGRTVAHGAVLFVALERADVTRRRLAAMAHGEDIAVAVASSFDPADDDAEQTVRDAILSLEQATGQPVRLVIFDTFGRLMAGDDENSSGAVGRVVKFLDASAKASGCAMLLIHHASKAGGARGSSALQAGADVVLRVEASRGRRIVVEKQSDGPEGAVLDFEIADDGDSITVRHIDAAQPFERSSAKRVTEAEKLVIEALAAGPVGRDELRDRIYDRIADRAPAARRQLLKRGIEMVVDSGMAVEVAGVFHLSTERDPA